MRREDEHLKSVMKDLSDGVTHAQAVANYVAACSGLEWPWDVDEDPNSDEGVVAARAELERATAELEAMLCMSPGAAHAKAKEAHAKMVELDVEQALTRRGMLEGLLEHIDGGAAMAYAKATGALRTAGHDVNWPHYYCSQLQSSLRAVLAASSKVGEFRHSDNSAAWFVETLNAATTRRNQAERVLAEVLGDILTRNAVREALRKLAKGE